VPDEYENCSTKMDGYFLDKGSKDFDEVSVLYGDNLRKQNGKGGS
jgi:hypothetical protein